MGTSCRRFWRAIAQKQVVVCLCLSGSVRVGFFWGGGGCINSPLDGEKCSAAEMHSKVGGELHGFHDYQVLWLGCGFGSVVA